MIILDSRRLTGPHLLGDWPGAVAEVKMAPKGRTAFAAAWAREARRLLDGVGWRRAELASRTFPSGLSLALSAPIDALYAAVDLNEAALARAEAEVRGVPPPPFAEAVAALRQAIAAESDPALVALARAARRHGVSFLADADFATVGLGTGSRTWPVGALPSPGEIDWKSVHDIPAVLVTGTNGKSTTVRLAAAIGAAAGLVTGTTSTDGIEVAGDWLEHDDFSGPEGARTLLRDRRVELAVLEVARGGILRRGLALRNARAAAVTNVAADHLGDYGVETLRDLTAAKLVVARAVPRDGRLVVNADDPRLKAAASKLLQAGVPLTWFGLDADSPVLRRAVRAGGDAAFLDAGEIVLAQGGRRSAVAGVAEIPVTHGGAAVHNVANVLAAVGLAAALGLPVAAMAAGLTSLASDPAGNPGRTNLFEIGGAQVLVDYAHNPHGVEALLGFAAHLAHAHGSRRRLLVLGQAGDRSDADLRALAAAALPFAPDRVILKELPEMLRGRPLGEIPAIFEAELLRLGFPRERLGHASSELDAVHQVLAWLALGDLAVLLVHKQRDAVLELLRQAQTRS